MNTGENEQALRKILDMTRLISLVVLFLHFYYECYGFFRYVGLATGFTDKILGNITATGLFASFHRSKLIALGLLAISLLGARGRKDEKLRTKDALRTIVVGIVVYLGGVGAFYIGFSMQAVAALYIIICVMGYLLMLSGGVRLSRIIRKKLDAGIYSTA